MEFGAPNRFKGARTFTTWKEDASIFKRVARPLFREIVLFPLLAQSGMRILKSKVCLAETVNDDPKGSNVSTITVNVFQRAV